MSSYDLIFYPFDKTPFSVSLSENARQLASAERIINRASQNPAIFSDLTYSFEIKSENISAIQDVQIYINDTYEPSNYENGKIFFREKGSKDKRIFIDCYGFIQICLIITFSDENPKIFYSEYLPVLVRKGKLNNAVQDMIKYVWARQNTLFSNGEPKPKNISGLNENGEKSLMSQIILGEEIASVYEKNYSYFKANSRFTVKKQPQIDRLEHLEYISPPTLSYIASHPEQLRRSNSRIGIKSGKTTYQPLKTLVMKNIPSYDIYENIAILSFLFRMIKETQNLHDNCLSLIKDIPSSGKYNSEYYYSHFFMFAETKKSLEECSVRLSVLSDRFTRLFGLYKNILNIPAEKIREDIYPHSTPIFMSVPEYNMIFIKMHEWFTFGIYDFTKESFMLSFIKLSSVYELYLLLKLEEYLQFKGYRYSGSLKRNYPVRQNWKYRNTRIDNTFMFSGRSLEIVLYYQPVVYASDKKSVNNIGLYRNNSLAVGADSSDDDYSGGEYYTPDFIIKISKDGRSQYVILDAKFSLLQNVRKYHIKDLAFKYLFSISPIDETDSISGIVILYGQCEDNEQACSAYNKQLEGRPVLPFFDLIPLMENIPLESQNNGLKQLFEKL